MTTFKKWDRAKHVEQAGEEEALAETRRMVDDFPMLGSLPSAARAQL